MITIEEIFSLTKLQLKNKLLEHEDKTHYSNNLERINAVIIHSFNKELLNSKEMEIVESKNYDRVMKSNPTSYSNFLELLNPKKKSNKINININPELLKFWNTPKITTLEGHTDRVNCVAVSGIINTPDELGKQYIISGSEDNTIKIWDLSTFELVTTLEGDTDYINCVAVSGIINTADNIEKQYIISGSDDETIKIWDLSTFELVATLEGHNYPVISIAVSGKYIISGSEDIKIWDLSTFELVETLEEHTAIVTSVAVSSVFNTAKFPDNIGKQYIISGSEDKTIKIWDFSTFKLVTTLEGHTFSVNSVAVSDKYIISGSNDSTIKIWDISTFELVETLEEHNGGVNYVAVSSNTAKFPDNIGKQYIISGSSDDTIKIWNILTFELVTTLENDTEVYSVAISSDNKYIISGLYNGKIKIWEKN